MSQKYKSTQDQMNKEFDALYRDMRDPKRQEQKDLELIEKKYVETTTKRYGLS